MIIFQVVPSKLKPQKQPSIGVLIKRYSENMQPIVRRTPMLKCDFKKLRKQLHWNHTSAVVISSKFAHNFRIHFLKNTCGGLLLKPLNCFIFLIIVDKISTKYQYRFKVKGNPKRNYLYHRAVGEKIWVLVWFFYLNSYIQFLLA